MDSIGGLRLRQPAQGYRFSIDSVLLSAFGGLKAPKKIADFGAGSGVVGLLLAQRFQKSHVTLVEVQGALYDLCLANIEGNNLGGRVDALNLDIKTMRGELHGLDMVFSNPPFRKPGAGRISVKGQRATARHETELTLQELCAAASRALRTRGRFTLVYHPERLVELIDELRAAGLEPKRLRFVHGRAALEARIILMEAVRHGRPGLKVEPPLFVFADDSDDYTPEVAAIYESLPHGGVIS